MIENRPTKEIYNNKIYENKGNKEVIQQVPDEANTILDVGCGAGDNARILKQLHKHVTGITISDSEALLAKEICDEIIIANIEDDNVNPGKKFDTIILSHVCEHLMYPDDAINKLSGWLNDSGIIIIAVPNMAYYKNRLKILSGNWTMNESGPFDKTHLHFYSYDSADTIYNNRQIKIKKKYPATLQYRYGHLEEYSHRFVKRLTGILGNIFQIYLRNRLSWF